MDNMTTITSNTDSNEQYEYSLEMEPEESEDFCVDMTLGIE
jgi:hypothetical protein